MLSLPQFSQPKSVSRNVKNDTMRLPSILDGLEFPHTLAPEIINLLVQGSDHVVRPVNRGPEFAPLSLPTIDAILFRVPASLFGVDFVAELAFLADRDRLHNQFHPTRFPCAVFSVAVLSEVSPFPVATRKSMLVKEAHNSVSFLGQS